MSKAPCLSVQDVSVCAGGTVLFEHITFDLCPGEIAALTAPSGTGKTTLLRALAWLDTPQAGTILLTGKTPGAWGVPEYRRKAVYVAQRPMLFDETVHANLKRPFQYNTAENAFPEMRAQTLLEQFGVGSERMEQNARSLSEGQQQRVCLIRALLLHPTVLLLDEPTSSLDAATVESIETHIREVVSADTLAVLAVTHDTAQANRWGDRTIRLTPFQPNREEVCHADSRSV